MNPLRTPETEDCTHTMSRCTIPALILLTVSVIGISIASISAGYVIIFQNAYYFPIILACACFPRRAMVYTALLSLTYLILLLGISQNMDLLPGALVRIFFFNFVALSMVYITNERIKAESELIAQKDSLNRVITEQTACIQQELEQSQRLEKAFRESNEYYEYLFNQLKAPLVFWNTEGYITRTNTAFDELLVLPKTEIIGRKLSTLLPFEGIEKENGGLDCTGDPVAFSIERADGSTAHALWTFSPIRKKEGQTAGILAVGQKITLA
jgi:PAS domain S-box-containing protein